jgi:hypothetical protein
MPDDDLFIRDDDDKNEFFNESDLDFDENADFFPKYYNLEEVFDTKIHPLLKTIVNICNEYNIPMITSFQYANSQNKVMLCTSIVVPPKRTCEKLSQVTKILLD